MDFDFSDDQEQLRDAVRKVGADVVFLQEVQGTHGDRALKFSGFPEAPHYEFLADDIWPQYAYGKNVSYPKGHHGNAVMSKFPIIHDQNHDVSVSGAEKRGLLHCVLRVPGQAVDVHVICVHLGLMERHRQEQLLLLAEMVRGEVPDNAPLIVAGDFNDWRNHAAEHLARRLGLQEAFSPAPGHAPARSFPAAMPMFRLDRIYIRGFAVARTAIHHGAPWSAISDHAALSAYLTPHAR